MEEEDAEDAACFSALTSASTLSTFSVGVLREDVSALLVLLD